MSVSGDGAPALGAADNVSRQKQADFGVMDGLSSSKVTVEYHDPSGLFPLVQEELSSRLPLRNLHWKSPTRPLRSIDSLHVDLVPSHDSVHISGVTSPGLAPPDVTAALTPTPTTTEHIRPHSKERRHQIPGLRQTPYLKIYLLRCDDSDTYKSTARKQLREWVKAHTPPSQSSSSSTQENHDAFEWMIIHVVIPDTAAASQPRGSSSSTTGEKEKSTATSRWTRGTTTILEKIRADFNVSSKTAPDRVVQIRLPKEAVPPHMLPTTPSITSPPITESPQEQEKAWADIITKFKTLILLSFDLRVSQYEEDIREKDSQRSLPGWNFCTFFILKEGLARGFESAGLVEDALLGYDELSIGLDTIIRDQASEGNEAQGGVFLTYSDDLYQQTSETLKRSQKGDGGRKEPQPHIHDEKPINSQKKDYRGLILSNNISVFDFKTYIFARQMSLLLRLGNSHSSRTDLASKLQPRPGAGVIQRSVDDSGVGTKSGSSQDDSEDLLSLTELCQRALNFITFAGRLLREDLVNGANAHQTKFPEQLVDNIVRSWTFAALEQILNETATSSLPFTKFSKSLSTGSSGKMLPFGGHAKEQKISVAEQKSMIHPSRSSSLNYGRSNSADPPYAQNPSSGQVVFENGQYQDRATPNPDSVIPQAKTGQQELAGTRAQLLVVQRRIVQHVGKSLHWSIGWAAILPKFSLGGFSDVDLDAKSGSEDEDAETVAEEKKENKFTSPTVGLSAAAIVSAVSSIDQFRQFYESLSDLIVKHYMAAGQTKSGESILGDLAALRFELGDFAAASMYFGRMASLFGESRWNNVEAIMLKMHAECLKKLNRKDEYVRTLLNLLAKSAASRIQARSTSKRDSSSPAPEMPKVWLNDDKVDTTGVFNELLQYSEQLPYDMNVQMPKYFGDIVVEPYVRHYDDNDGFQLRLQFRHILDDDIEIQAAKVRLVSATSAQGKDIWLENAEPTFLKKGLCRLWLSSNVNTTGPYVVDKIVLQAKRLVFAHEPFARTEAATPLGIITSVAATPVKTAKKARILCFPRTEAFQSRLYLSHFIHIDKPRHLEIELSSGWNDIQRADIRLKSASAGLRLRTADASTVGGDEIVEKKRPTPGVVSIGAVGSDSTVTLKIPYDVETAPPELTIKVEIDYHTEKGQFQYLSSFTIPIELPLDVNVHDHFKNQALFSKFNVKTANQVPLEVLNVGLQGSEEFDVHAPKGPYGPFHVFPKQPVSMTYKITKKLYDNEKRRQSRLTTTGSLSLTVEYHCLNEYILDRVRELFAEAVKNSPVHRLTRLLIHTFSNRVEHRVLPHQFEKIALLNKVDMGAFEDMGWAECIDSLPHIVRDDTRSWLQKWHENHKTIHLAKPDANTDTDIDTPPPFPSTAPPSPFPPRRMTITVAIPQTHILHTLSLSLSPPSPPHPSPTSQPILTAGQPILTTLRISHTRRWCQPSNLVSAGNLSSPSDPINFIYALEPNNDVWLIGGQRRGHYSAKEDEVKEFPIMLIPLKAGTWLLPNVDVRARPASKSEAAKRQSQSGSGGQTSTAANGEEELNCEVDNLGYGESVVVVPDVRSSTMGIGDMGLGGVSASSGSRGAVFLESVGMGVGGEV